MIHLERDFRLSFGMDLELESLKHLSLGCSHVVYWFPFLQRFLLCAICNLYFLFFQLAFLINDSSVIEICTSVVTVFCQKFGQNFPHLRNLNITLHNEDISASVHHTNLLCLNICLLESNATLSPGLSSVSNFYLVCPCNKTPLACSEQQDLIHKFNGHVHLMSVFAASGVFSSWHPRPLSSTLCIFSVTLTYLTFFRWVMVAHTPEVLNGTTPRTSTPHLSVSSALKIAWHTRKPRKRGIKWHGQLVNRISLVRASERCLVVRANKVKVGYAWEPGGQGCIGLQ